MSVGSVRLADLAEAFDVELPTEEFDSVADFIMACLDRVPSEGGDAYSLVGPRLTLEVVEMDGPRIKRGGHSASIGDGDGTPWVSWTYWFL